MDTMPTMRYVYSDDPTLPPYVYDVEMKPAMDLLDEPESTCDLCGAHYAPEEMILRVNDDESAVEHMHLACAIGNTNVTITHLTDDEVTTLVMLEGRH